MTTGTAPVALKDEQLGILFFDKSTKKGAQRNAWQNVRFYTDAKRLNASIEEMRSPNGPRHAIRLIQKPTNENPIIISWCNGSDKTARCRDLTALRKTILARLRDGFVITLS
jgi:hypothetical protein